MILCDARKATHTHSSLTYRKQIIRQKNSFLFFLVFVFVICGWRVIIHQFIQRTSPIRHEVRIKQHTQQICLFRILFFFFQKQKHKKILRLILIVSISDDDFQFEFVFITDSKHVDERYTSDREKERFLLNYHCKYFCFTKKRKKKFNLSWIFNECEINQLV